MWSDTLKCEEVEESLKAVNILQHQCNWSKQLLKSRQDILDWLALPLSQRSTHSFNPSDTEVKSFLFEIRFALELYRAGVTAEYEFPTGVGESSVDFRIIGRQEWLVELVSLFESQAIKDATRQHDVQKGLSCYGMRLSSHSQDPRQSEEGEMIKAQQRVAAKAFDGKQPKKFPVSVNAYNLVMVDARGYLGHGGDCIDFYQMSLGPDGMDPFHIRYWTDPHNHTRSPIKGLFETGNPLNAAKIFQERVHFIGWLCEKTYQEGEISKNLLFYANPHLFESKNKIETAYNSFPLSKHMPQRDLFRPE